MNTPGNSSLPPSRRRWSFFRSLPAPDTTHETSRRSGCLSCLSCGHSDGGMPLWLELLLLSGGTGVGMTIFETAKDFFLPGISKWESHMITIPLTVLLVTSLSYCILSRQRTLQNRLYDSILKQARVSGYLASIVRSTRDAIISLDHGGVIISWNPGAEALFGYPAGEITGKHVTTLTPGEFRDRVPGFIDQVTRDGSLRYDGVFLGKDGRNVHLSVTGTRIAGSGEISGHLAIIGHDISLQVAREEMLRMLNLKQHLLSGITSHDIGNRVKTLISSVSLLKGQVTDPDLSHLVAVIDEQITLIGNQISFMKEYEELGIRSPVWQSAEEVFSGMSESFDLPPSFFSISLDRLEVYADPLLEKVIYNLCDNAIRYGGTLTGIRSSYHRDADSCIWVVEDDGIGIEEDQKEKIFEKGFGKTNGLGLYFVREILSITTITIRETGHPEEGARFELIIPPGNWRLSSSP